VNTTPSASVPLDLCGRTALVTGSTQGIGLAIARRLRDAGAEVIVNGRGAERVREVVDTANADRTAPRLRGIAADVTTAEGAQQLVETAGEVDVLVNNLGVFGSADALEISDDEWRRYFDVNVLAAARLTRLLLPAMMTRGWGRVLNIASDSAVVIPAEMIHYGVSKTALLALSRGYAKTAAGTGVTVNSVIAGPTHTEGVEDFVYEMVDRSLPWDEAQREFMRTARPQSLLGRLIEPEEIANMVLYLASPLASATTGGALRVDGGYVDAILP
jgi:NAD(P)-dependent dehydrogenase (short-subunit alcohol dehydrogenase family)